MRILHLTNELNWRGGENQIRLLVLGLQKQGIYTAVALPRNSKALPIFQQICDVVVLPSRATWDPRNWWCLQKFVKSNNIDLINAHSSGAMSWGLLLKRFRSELKFVVHRRTAFPLKNNYFTRKKYFNPNVDAFVCISSAIADVLQAYGISSDKIYTVKSAVDSAPYTEDKIKLARQSWRQQLGFTEHELVIGCASALAPEKGHEKIITACRDLQERGLSFKCVFAGSGPLEEELKQKVTAAGLDQQIRFLGFVKDIYGFLCALDILLMPSKSEGLGTILLEAAYAGCALIGSRVGGIPEVIIDHKTGLLFDYDDFGEFKKQLLLLGQDAELRKNLSVALREHVKKEFSLSSMVQGNISVYQKIMQKH